MKFTSFTICVLSVGLVGVAAQSAFGTVIVQNAGFEDTVLDTGGNTILFRETAPRGENTGILLPAITGWTFGASSADGSVECGMITACGHAGWQVTPFGDQCAALHGVGSSVAQTITGFNAGIATFSFYAQAFPTLVGPMTVQLDGTALKFDGGTSLTPNNATMTQYTTDPIAVTAGPHTLNFSCSQWTFLDNVSATNTIPEPTSIMLVASAVVGLLAYAWRNRK